MPEYWARGAFRSTEATTGALVVNSLHFGVAVLTDPPNWTSVAADIGSWLGPWYLDILSSNHILHDLTVTDEDYEGSTHGQGLFSWEQPGNRVLADHRLDPALCATVSWKTAVAKRYARGHSFMPPAGSETTTAEGGIWNVAGPYITAIASFAQHYNDGHTVSSTDYAPIVYSRTRQKLGLTPFHFPIISHRVNVKQSYLRSRQTAP